MTKIRSRAGADHRERGQRINACAFSRTHLTCEETVPTRQDRDDLVAEVRDHRTSVLLKWTFAWRVSME
jgi:hypothetical protein